MHINNAIASVAGKELHAGVSRYKRAISRSVDSTARAEVAE